MSRHDPIVRVHHMLDCAREAVEMIRERSRADLDRNRMLNLALVRLVEVIGEAASGVPEEFLARYPNVPWRQTVGIRNRLIHGYETVNLDILWAVIREDLPALIDQLEEILRKEA